MGYNLLTLQLQYEGYTPENHPAFVRVDSSRLPGDNPLRNLGGGFVYESWHLDSMVFKTPCGCHVKGRNVLHNMHCYISWQPENNNPVIVCPYAWRKEFFCEKIHPFLKTRSCGIQFCSCHATDEPYDYEKSIEKARDDEQKRRNELYKEFVASKNGHVCINHARFNEEKDAWEQHYSPYTCAHRCFSEFCPIRGRALDKKKANVYYDVYRSGVYEDGFIRQEWKKAEKGIPFFEKPVSRDICEAFVKMESHQITRKYAENHSTEKMFDPTVQVGIVNIRVESRPSRDLMQDLLDIQEGRFVSWAPEEEKEKKEQKKQRRKDAAKKRQKKLERKIIKSGFESLGEAERIRAKKLMSAEQIRELQKVHEEKPVFEQVDLMNLFMNGGN